MSVHRQDQASRKVTTSSHTHKLVQSPGVVYDVHVHVKEMKWIEAGAHCDCKNNLSTSSAQKKGWTKSLFLTHSPTLSHSTTSSLAVVIRSTGEGKEEYYYLRGNVVWLRMLLLLLGCFTASISSRDWARTRTLTTFTVFFYIIRWMGTTTIQCHHYWSGKCKSIQFQYNSFILSLRSTSRLRCCSLWIEMDDFLLYISITEHEKENPTWKGKQKEGRRK